MKSNSIRSNNLQNKILNNMCAQTIKNNIIKRAPTICCALY